MKKLFTLILVTVTLFSCMDNREKISKQISDLENEIRKEDFPSEDKMNAIINLYDTFISAYPDDEKTYSYMEMKAKYLLASENYEEAVKTYKDIIESYSNNERTPENIFMLAFIYDTHLGDKKQAELLYKQVLKKYPNHDLADDAQFSLENLYMSESDILRMIEERSKNVFEEE